MTDNILPCYYALSSINYKNGFVTTCAQQSDHLHTLTKTVLPSEFLNNDNFEINIEQDFNKIIRKIEKNLIILQIKMDS